jgi:hypothetical protein
MSGSRTVRLSNGGTLVVRTGMLRGAGPQGPTGPVGPQGSAGPTGATGPAGSVGDASGLAQITTSNAQAVTSAMSPKILTLDTNAAQGASANPLNLAGGNAFNVTITGVYSITLAVQFATPTGATGNRRVGIYPSGSTTPLYFAELPAKTNNTATVVQLTLTGYFLSSQVYNVRVSTDGSNDTVNAGALRVSRTGVGNAGPTGPAGPQGPTGPTGPTGLTGSAGGGYASLESLSSTAGTDANPADGSTTADQAIPYPVKTGKVYLAYWFKTVIEWFEKRIVARYSDTTSLDTKRPAPSAGEVYFITGDSSLWVRGASTRYPVAQVRVSTSAAPGSGTYPAGTIWIQV